MNLKIFKTDTNDKERMYSRHHMKTAQVELKSLPINPMFDIAVSRTNMENLVDQNKLIPSDFCQSFAWLTGPKRGKSLAFWSGQQTRQSLSG
ncbi:hypothetical protein Hanom_Chr08g00758721 [Helianthus anomalus]